MQHSLTILAQGAAPAGPGNPMGMIVTMGLIFAIFYFMLIRPQQRKEKDRRKTIETLRAGQRVIFAGGLIGTIVEARPHTFAIEIARGVTVEVARGAISRLLKEGETPAVEETRG
ncbi:MAG: preprotein translocase subunit YajC [Kiritimatiellae bacterium]|nr:preprotein translocase subunit YajC [Kiritimatiellia bacterium]